MRKTRKGKISKGDVVWLKDWGVIGKVVSYEPTRESITLEWPNDGFWNSPTQRFYPVTQESARILSAEEVLEKMAVLTLQLQRNVMEEIGDAIEHAARWKLLGTRS